MKFISEVKYKGSGSPSGLAGANAKSSPTGREGLPSAKKGFWFIFDKNNMLFFQGKDNIIPELVSPSDIGVNTTTPVYFGTIDGNDCWTAEAVNNIQTAEKKAEPNAIPAASASSVLPPPAPHAPAQTKAETKAGEDSAVISAASSAANADHQNFYFKNLRELYSLLGDELFSIASRALQINRWHLGTKYCSSCGSILKDSETERAKICKNCSEVFYPIISPAIIVAITKENKILLAHNNAYPDPKRYSILAGFVEPGESFEQTVAREVEEEVNIKIKNIKYCGSQSWPFPHSLMVGFTAEYDSGEIKVDGIEIGTADWFEVSQLPSIPPHGSISRALIDNFVRQQKEGHVEAKPKEW